MTNSIPQHMTAVQLVGHGGIEMLHYREDVPVPVPGPGEVLIKVAAAGVNNTDINTRTGWYSKAVRGATAQSDNASANAEDPSWGGAPITFPRIQGADTVGEVVAVGDSVDQSWVGARVITDGWLRNWDEPGDARVPVPRQCAESVWRLRAGRFSARGGQEPLQYVIGSAVILVERSVLAP